MTKKAIDMLSPTATFYRDLAQHRAEHPDTTRAIGQHGYIELESTWGDEATILNTARISTGNSRLSSVTEFTEKDRRLLFELLRDQHGTPFETIYFRYRFVAPIFVLRQWVKHRISSWNEFSMRYRSPIDAFYLPDDAATHVDGFPVMDEEDLESYNELMHSVLDWQSARYAKTCRRIDEARERGELPPKTPGRDPYRGRARELLRNVMPVSAYSDVYWTVNLRSLMNFFQLRCKSGAQYEIREYANAARDLFAAQYPLLSEVIEEVAALHK
jgi:thymidylate synthase (FAD)